MENCLDLRISISILHCVHSTSNATNTVIPLLSYHSIRHRCYCCYYYCSYFLLELSQLQLLSQLHTTTKKLSHLELPPDDVERRRFLQQQLPQLFPRPGRVFEEIAPDSFDRRRFPKDRTRPPLKPSAPVKPRRLHFLALRDAARSSQAIKAEPPTLPTWAGGGGMKGGWAGVRRGGSVKRWWRGKGIKGREKRGSKRGKGKFEK